LEEVEGYEEHSDEYDDNNDEERSSVEDDDDTTTPIVCDDKIRDAQRLFLWRDRQKEQVEKILDSIESGNSSMTSAILDFSQSFVFHKVYHKPFESLMLHFIAILGIDEENNRLKEANDYSYMLAGLVYCTRVIGLEFLLPSKNRELQSDVDYETFLQQRKQFLADGSMSVVSNMISLLAYSKHIAMNHSNAGSVF
jgi:hypothetical protein